MIDDAERRGKLAPGGLIIEPTSGNTGIGLAAIAAARGYRVVLTMPDTMSVERRAFWRPTAPRSSSTPGEKGMAGSIEKAEELCRENPGSFLAGQFENPANPAAHYHTTGPEIWEQCGGKLDIFLAGVGTGGTLTGVGRYLKEQDPAIQVVAMEPAGSPVLSQGKSGLHGLQGIGAGFVPKALDTTVYDQVVTVTEEEAYSAARRFAKTEGVLVGISSGRPGRRGAPPVCPGKPGQDPGGPPARHRRPLPLHPAVRGLSHGQKILRGKKRQKRRQYLPKLGGNARPR